MSDFPAWIALMGAIATSLIAAFAGLVALISGKESKVSEFRQLWIDGLRNDIADFAAATHELSFIDELDGTQGVSKLEFAKLSAAPFTAARSSITRIQLRLNPKRRQDPRTVEGAVWSSLITTRNLFNDKKYTETIESLELLRETSAKLLKKEWGRVKSGEFVFRIVKAVTLLISALAIYGLYYLIQNFASL
jgi:hypothetical protein